MLDPVDLDADIAEPPRQSVRLPATGFAERPLAVRDTRLGLGVSHQIQIGHCFSLSSLVPSFIAQVTSPDFGSGFELEFRVGETYLQLVPWRREIITVRARLTPGSSSST